MKVIIVSLALIVCWVYCAPTSGTTKTPFVKLSCTGHKANGFFVDPNDPTIFHQCSHGTHIATFHCQSGTVFNETAQVCVVNSKIIDAHCPKPEGLFIYPGNPHKFINCNGGHAFVEACAADLVFDESKQECVYNDKGLTWETDPPIKPTTPTGAPTQAPTQKASETSKAHENTTPEAKVTSASPVDTTAKPECEGKGYIADEADKKKYFICKNGKKLHETCPDDTEFDPVIKQCS